MTDVAIRAEGLGKRYRIGMRRPDPQGAWDKFGRLAAAPFEYLRTTLRDPVGDEAVWAIQDVSFEVKAGGVVGLVGRNGAGKSTLLKVLTRITDPTEGRAEIHGRVGSLLEVGTGFHPELTGRENVYLNGSILGMTRREISSRFDEIVEFAEVSRFLDTPVKRYSSGMYVRLAFSVAAHLEPEILIVDEVLAVGDASFQRKCLDKMEEVTSNGRTILFVSHNMAAINRLCATALLMDRGQLAAFGEVDEITSRYLSQESTVTAEWHAPPSEGLDHRDCYVQAARVLDDEGHRAETIGIDEPVHLEVDYHCRKSGVVVHVQVQVLNEVGEVLFASTDNLEKDRRGWRHEAGVYRSCCSIPAHLLAEGAHYVSVVLLDSQRRHNYQAKRRILAFWITDPADGTTVRGSCPGDWPGVMRPMLPWQVSRLEQPRHSTSDAAPLQTVEPVGAREPT